MMYPLQNLYDLARDRGIPIYDFDLPVNGSVSIMDEDGSCYIGMDHSVLDANAAERVHLGHELGHCETGSFYSIYTRVDSRQRHENRADKWAIRKLMPRPEVERALQKGFQLWELAELFGVTEQFARKAVCLYRHGNLAAENYR